MSNRDETHIDEELVTDTVMSVLNSCDHFSRLSTSLTGTLSLGLLGNDPTDSIKIINDKKGIIISIRMVLYYGINIPQFSYELQSKINVALKKVGIDPQAVNIIVEGIERKQVSNE